MFCPVAFHQKGPQNSVIVPDGNRYGYGPLTLMSKLNPGLERMFPIEHQQGFAQRAPVQAVQALSEGLVQNQTAPLIRVAQLEAHPLQSPPAHNVRHVEHVVPGRGPLVQGQLPLLQGGALPQPVVPGGHHAVQADRHAERAGVEGLPEQDQLRAQHGGVKAADVKPDPSWWSNGFAEPFVLLRFSALIHQQQACGRPNQEEEHQKPQTHTPGHSGLN
ncbi:unnamed protein product [Menidia menidia]|uniref:(Atlantic silverside) hypothetical protein n=1 Tax=Menidia menidia TaxID=238744 RepID=A0A8S4BGY8_9TELE|nr:unnamed protein product [Menidia menidia]